MHDLQGRQALGATDLLAEDADDLDPLLGQRQGAEEGVCREEHSVDIEQLDVVGDLDHRVLDKPHCELDVRMAHKVLTLGPQSRSDLVNGAEEVELEWLDLRMLLVLQVLERVAARDAEGFRRVEQVPFSNSQLNLSVLYKSVEHVFIVGEEEVYSEAVDH